MVGGDGLVITTGSQNCGENYYHRWSVRYHRQSVTGDDDRSFIAGLGTN
jgi:hypothetical protein